MRLHVLTFVPALAFSLATAPAQSLDAVLDKAAKQAEQFTATFPSLACTERLTQVRFGQGEKVANRRESIYDYLILMDTDGGEFTVDESRLEKSKPQKDPQQALLATTGFAVLQVIFHPHFQSGYRFQDLEPETRAGVTWRRIAFEHLAGHSSPTVLEVKGREYPIAWRGTAWLDPKSGAIGRIHTELREPLADIGLESLSSDVEYGPGASSVNVWVPRLAVVEARTAHQRWRNQHEFSAYRVFEVTAQQKVQQIPETGPDKPLTEKNQE